MKKSIFILICLSLLQILTVKAQDKNVYWLHGLNDTEEAWKHYADIFARERTINSERPRYNSNEGVSSSTTSVNNKIIANPQNIGIGHSMGGIVLRNLDRFSTPSARKINGLITVASPNGGAGIANAFDDNSLLRASQQACGDLASAPTLEQFTNQWVFATIGVASLITGRNLTPITLCQSFANNKTLENFAGSPAARNDLKQGSGLLSDLNSFNSAIPNLTMIAQENSPVHWRLIGSTLSRDNTTPNDRFFPDAVTVGREVYNGFFIARTAGTVVSAIFGFINPALFAVAAINGVKATQWKRGRDWIDESETIWNGLTRASRLEQQNYVGATWFPCESPWPPAMMSQDMVNARTNSCGEWVFVERTRNVMVHHPSDGFIPSYSQDRTSLPASNRYFINGANHIEVLNMSGSRLNGAPNDATKAEFDKVFEIRSDIFNTPRR
jgi:hypothetical protein